MYSLEKELIVNVTPEEAWAFIRDPKNLDLITPDDMAFEIVSKLPAEMFEGMLVEYRVKIPIVGKQEWLSELKHIVPGKSFVDEQKIGPYKFWYHYHSVEPAANGVKLVDRITYAVPFGIFGKIAHALFIRKTLGRIFQHREKMFRQLLEKTDG